MNYFKTIALTLGYFLFANPSVLAEKTPPEGVVPVNDFELERYLGLWYEIARTDNRYERGLRSVTAEYRLQDDGTVRVINRGYHAEHGQWEVSKAKARKIGDPDAGKLKVTFFWPFSSGYHVFALDQENYNYALVSGDHHGYLWILSRTPDLPESTINKLLREAREAGFDTSDLVWVDHHEVHPSMLAR